MCHLCQMDESKVTAIQQLVPNEASHATLVSKSRVQTLSIANGTDNGRSLVNVYQLVYIFLLLSLQFLSCSCCHEKECNGQVPVVENGYVQWWGDNSLGAVRNVECLEGFEIQGWSRIFCRLDGTWSQPGTCRKFYFSIFCLYL